MKDTYITRIASVLNAKLREVERLPQLSFLPLLPTAEITTHIEWSSGLDKHRF